MRGGATRTYVTSSEPAPPPRGGKPSLSFPTRAAAPPHGRPWEEDEKHDAVDAECPRSYLYGSVAGLARQ